MRENSRKQDRLESVWGGGGKRQRSPSVVLGDDALIDGREGGARVSRGTVTGHKSFSCEGLKMVVGVWVGATDSV